MNHAFGGVCPAQLMLLIIGINVSVPLTYLLLSQRLSNTVVGVCPANKKASHKTGFRSLLLSIGGLFQVIGKERIDAIEWNHICFVIQVGMNFTFQNHHLFWFCGCFISIFSKVA